MGKTVRFLLSLTVFALSVFAEEGAYCTVAAKNAGVIEIRSASALDMPIGIESILSEAAFQEVVTTSCVVKVVKNTVINGFIMTALVKNTRIPDPIDPKQRYNAVVPKIAAIALKEPMKYGSEKLLTQFPIKAIVELGNSRDFAAAQKRANDMIARDPAISDMVAATNAGYPPTIEVEVVDPSKFPELFPQNYYGGPGQPNLSKHATLSKCPQSNGSCPNVVGAPACLNYTLSGACADYFSGPQGGVAEDILGTFSWDPKNGNQSKWQYSAVIWYTVSCTPCVWNCVAKGDWVQGVPVTTIGYVKATNSNTGQLYQDGCRSGNNAIGSQVVDGLGMTTTVYAVEYWCTSGPLG